MTYKFDYKNDIEREVILRTNSSLFLIEEQNIIDGNFLIFVDVQPQQEDLSLKIRINTVSEYLSQDISSITDIEDYILKKELNNLNGGM
jgi:hypothetical protein